MPTYMITAPDGRKFKVTAPAGTTKTEVLARIQAGPITQENKVRAAMLKNPGSLDQPDPTSGMGVGDLMLAGAGKGMTDLARGVGQVMGKGPSPQEVDEQRALDAPLMAHGAAKGGALIGKALPAAALAGLPGGSTVLGSAAIGALEGAAEPVGTDDSRVRNTARGAFVGAAVPAGVNAARGAGAFVAPFTEGGRSRIVGRGLTGAAQDPKAAMAAARSAPEPVPGYQPTLVEATLDPGLAVLQRGAQSADLQTAAALAERGTQQIAAINRGLGDMAGDDASREALKVAREQATEKLYKASGGVQVPVDKNLATLMQRPSMAKAVERAKELAQERGEVLADPATGTVTGQGLHYIKMALDDMLDGAATSGIGRNEQAAISGTRSAYLEWLETAIPDYGTARQTFSEMSKPLNQSQVAQYLSDKLNPALADAGTLPRVKAETYATAVRNARKTAQDATGFKGATLENTMTPEQMVTIKGVSKALNARANAADLGRGAGSNTAQNLATQNLMSRAGLGGAAASKVAEVLKALLPSSIVNSLKPGFSEMAGSAVNARVAKAILDPKDAAALMGKEVTRAQRERLVRALVSRGLAPGAAAYATQDTAP